VHRGPGGEERKKNLERSLVLGRKHERFLTFLTVAESRYKCVFRTDKILLEQFLPGCFFSNERMIF